MKIAVVVPVYNEEENLPELAERLRRTLDSTGLAWTVLAVDDGSQDSSARMLAELSTRDPRFRFLSLSRNFGHQAAYTAGLRHVDADAVITLDADLQDPPELIPDLVKAWKQGADVVLARRRSRAETGLRGLAFRTFHRIFHRLVDFPIPPNVGTFGLMSRRAVEAFCRLPERHRFLPGLRAWIGFPVAWVDYDRQGRQGGEPKMDWFRLVSYALDGLFSFSRLPLRLLTWTGLAVSGLGFGLAVFFIAKRLLGLESAFTGFTTLVSVVCFLGGLQLVALGIVGEYVGRIYDEVKRRPLFLLREPPGEPER